MTHDELLAKILETGMTAKDVVTGNWIYERKTEALRAVVELHDEGNGICQECSYHESGMTVAYPCPTIQAIEKELQ